MVIAASFEVRVAPIVAGVLITVAVEAGVTEGVKILAVERAMGLLVAAAMKVVV